jgi:DNA-directed RNA polymerase subunit RPC12/RpoP
MKHRNSAERCERCGQNASALNYDPLIKKYLCSDCDRKIQSKRFIHGVDSQQDESQSDEKKEESEPKMGID